MRNLYILFFCCLTALSQAQQWQPIRVGEQYNFESCRAYSTFAPAISCYGALVTQEPTQLCNYSIWVDSVKIVGSDSVFYLNKTLKYHRADSTWFPSLEYYYTMQPLFAQAQCIKKNNGEYWLASPDTFIIKSQAQIHDTWAFVPDSSIWATVDTVVWDSVIGNNMDSVKYIRLSNNDTVLLSQNYGFLQFPNFGIGENYTLVGIEGNRIVDEPLAGYKDFYNFDVGDIFAYLREYYAFSEGHFEQNVWKSTIMDKQIYGDTISYTLKSQMQGTGSVPYIYTICITSDSIYSCGGNSVPYDWFFLMTWLGVFSTSENYYVNMQAIAHTKPSALATIIDKSSSVYMYCLINYLKHGGKIFKSSIYVDSLAGANAFATPTMQSNSNGEFDVFEFPSIEIVFAEGLGLVKNTWDFFESTVCLGLVAYYKSSTGETFGVIPADSIMGMGFIAEQSFTLAPAPAQHYFNILGIEKMQEPAQLLIYNLQGVLMQQQQVSATDNTVWINNLPTGIYAVVLQNELGRWTQKLSVLRE
jgi:hypothetical protein